MNAVLQTIRKEDPGRYPTDEELRHILEAEPYLEARVRALRSAKEHEKAIVQGVVDQALKKYDFSGRGGFGPAKCYRDVGLVYRHCVFAMLCDDLQMLKEKLLYWLRTILQAQNFPCGVESIVMVYSRMRAEVARRLPPEDAKLLDPYFAAAATILPSENPIE